MVSSLPLPAPRTYRRGKEELTSHYRRTATTAAAFHLTLAISMEFACRE
jgi:hypothetical protein